MQEEFYFSSSYPHIIVAWRKPEPVMAKFLNIVMVFSHLSYIAIGEGITHIPCLVHLLVEYDESILIAIEQ